MVSVSGRVGLAARAAWSGTLDSTSTRARYASPQRKGVGVVDPGGQKCPGEHRLQATAPLSDEYHPPGHSWAMPRVQNHPASQINWEDRVALVAARCGYAGSDPTVKYPGVTGSGEELPAGQ